LFVHPVDETAVGAVAVGGWDTVERPTTAGKSVRTSEWVRG
jgi:hypothetical protein